ncbi:AraC family transcriptional regulator [Paenibacillus sinopodophylli]|uniref:AraC family transcriptional regulator n=1 Tax=Paenibacillus sinopodophylli TaxID=1837342 RepID=UPI00110D08AB|nr:helix-turn-helix domain-containing protein [Paenibacillus sinopodophylli]
MDHFQLDQYLRQLDSIEQIQVITRSNVNEFDGKELKAENSSTVPRMKEEYFFDQGPIFISKHHRFAPMPLHNHTFLELNYMFSGQCKQEINGNLVQISQGQVCMLDKDVLHRIYPLGENDILINIIIKKDSLLSRLLSRLNRTGIVSSFLSNALSENQSHDRYVLFHSENRLQLHNLIKDMMCEYFDADDLSMDMVGYYIPLVFTELMRVYRTDKNFELNHTNGQGSIIDILHYIEQNFRDCTLTGLAEAFGFNANYLGNMLKERTGQTFLALIQTQRMVQAVHLLKDPDKKIDEIAYEIGYESPGFFYRKFKDYYGQTPNRYRKSMETEKVMS